MSGDNKMKILKMLEEGKISAEDAAKLLAASDVEGGVRMPGAPSPGSEPRPNAQSGASSFGGGSAFGGSTAQGAGSSYGGSSSFGGGSAYGSAARSTGQQQRPYTGGASSARPASDGNFAEDLGRKFDSFMRDIEPKLRTLSEKVAEKTSDLADNISKSMSSYASTGSRGPAPAPRPAPAPAPPRSAGMAAPSGVVMTDYEFKLPSGDCELRLSSINGPISVKGYNGDKITAQISYKQKTSGASLSFMPLGNKFYLDFDEDRFEKVAIDAYIPYNMFRSLSLSAMNGAVSLTGIDCEEIKIQSGNNDVYLSDVKGRAINVDAQNCREIKFERTVFTAAEIDGSNGTISFIENDIETLKLSAMQSTINLNISDFKRFTNYTWVLETSNQKINAFLPSSRTIGYYIKASAPLGAIRVGLTGMNYIYNDESNSELRSVNYDEALKKVRLSLETSNAALNIN